MRKFVMAALMFGMAQSAQAADLPDFAPVLRGAFPEGLSSTRVAWQGYYAGGQASYGAIRTNTPPGLNSDLQSRFIAPNGFAYNAQPLGIANETRTGYGGFAGYNSQWDDVVIGIEANYIHGGFKPAVSSVGYTYFPDFSIASTTNSSAVLQLSDFGSLRLRAGYAYGSFLPYAFVGAGVGSATTDRFVSTIPAPVLAVPSSDSRTKLVYGYSVGLGVDVMLVGGLFVRAEYEYQRVAATIQSNINAGRVGVGYKF